MTQFHNSEYIDILQRCCESIKYCAWNFLCSLCIFTNHSVS